MRTKVNRLKMNVSSNHKGHENMAKRVIGGDITVLKSTGFSSFKTTYALSAAGTKSQKLLTSDKNFLYCTAKSSRQNLKPSFRFLELYYFRQAWRTRG